jgi:hypothetical protein
VPVMLIPPWEWDSYGYEFMERAAAFGFEATNPGLHRTLRHIEEKAATSSGGRRPKTGRRAEYTRSQMQGKRPRKPF